MCLHSCSLPRLVEHPFCIAPQSRCGLHGHSHPIGVAMSSMESEYFSSNRVGRPGTWSSCSRPVRRRVVFCFSMHSQRTAAPRRDSGMFAAGARCRAHSHCLRKAVRLHGSTFSHLEKEIAHEKVLAALVLCGREQQGVWGLHHPKPHATLSRVEPASLCLIQMQSLHTP